MTRRQFNSLVDELEGKSPFVTLHMDAVAPKYVGVEVSKDGVIYYYSLISINDEYKPKKALVSRILGVARDLDGDKGSKQA